MDLGDEVNALKVERDEKSETCMTPWHTYLISVSSPFLKERNTKAVETAPGSKPRPTARTPPLIVVFVHTATKEYNTLSPFSDRHSPLPYQRTRREHKLYSWYLDTCSSCSNSPSSRLAVSLCKTNILPVGVKTQWLFTKN